MPKGSRSTKAKTEGSCQPKEPPTVCIVGGVAIGYNIPVGYRVADLRECRDVIFADGSWVADNWGTVFEWAQNCKLERQAREAN